MLGARELYDGLASGRYMVYDKKSYRFISTPRALMEERRQAFDDLLKDVRAR